MKKILFLLMFPVLCFGQGGHYGGNNQDVAQICKILQKNNFSSNTAAEEALNRILSVIGVAKNFALYQCSDIENCAAVTYNGDRYILYDSEFMDVIKNTTNSWSNLSILAHEIGHHVNGHTIDMKVYSLGSRDAPTLSKSRIQELEADEFSGFVLCKLGASLKQAQVAINSISSDGDDTYSTHPNKEKRLKAIETGFNNAKNQLPISINIVPKKYEFSAEYYYITALNANKDSINFKIKNYTNSIELNYELKSKAYFERALLYKDLGDNIYAIRDMNEVIYLDSKNKDAYLLRAELFMNIGEFSKAIKDFNNIVDELSIKDENVYISRGGLYEKIRDYTKAINDYTSAIKLNQNNSEVFIKRGKAKEKADFVFCYDFKKACQLNNKEGCELFNRKCN